MHAIGRHHAFSAQQVNWPQASGDATSRKAVGNLVSACCCIGASSRYSLNTEAIDLQGIGQLNHIVRPVQDFATWLKIGKPHARPIYRDETNTSLCRSPCKEIALKP